MQLLTDVGSRVSFFFDAVTRHLEACFALFLRYSYIHVSRNLCGDVRRLSTFNKCNTYMYVPVTSDVFLK